MPVVMVILSMVSLLAGALIAGTAPYWPNRQTFLENFGGGIFVVGIALLGASFPAV